MGRCLWRGGRSLMFALLLSGGAAVGCPGVTTADEECEMNGRLEGSSCVCNAGWSGRRCGTLDLLPASPDAGFVPRGSDGANSWSSWGGSVVRGADGQWHMLSAQMTNGCGIFSYCHAILEP